MCRFDRLGVEDHKVRNRGSSARISARSVSAAVLRSPTPVYLAAGSVGLLLATAALFLIGSLR
jgi:hypothetical protein